MRVLVTGGNGFLGKHVCRLLGERGHEVIVASPEWGGPPASLDCIVHLAARVGGIGRNVAEPWDMLADNLKCDTLAVQRACGEGTWKPVKFIGIGSVCMYPANAPLPLKEDSIWDGYPEPTNGPYGIAKRVQLELLRAAHAQYGLPYTFLILANLYGPGDHFDRDDAHVIPMLVRKAVEASEAGGVLEVWGDGTPTRDFLYVQNAAETIADAVESPAMNAAVNVGSGRETHIQDVVAYLVRRFQVPMRYVSDKPNGQPRRALACERRTTCIDIEEGLRRTVDWYLTNRESKSTIPENK